MPGRGVFPTPECKAREDFPGFSGILPKVAQPMSLSVDDQIEPPARQSARRDAFVVLGLVAVIGFLAGHFELNERLYAFTRHWEGYQLDEWPTVALTLTLGLVWFSIRRYSLARTELRARRRAEADLAQVLAENRRLTQQHVWLQESTQKHLARELHDELGQYTNAIKLDAVAIQRNADCTCNTSRPGAARIVEAVNHMHAVVSDMVRRLRPAGLDELGLEAALDQCVTHWRQRMPDTTVVLSLDGDFDGLGELATLTLYRLVQEGLTNASKHSGARHVEVRLKAQGDHGAAGRITVEIGDDGRGADIQPYRPGFGLNSMRERVQMLGGTFAVATAPQSGFRIAVTLPASARQ